MNFLKEHPFGVKAHFDQSLVLTYAVAAEELRKLVPAPLELDLYQEKIAFVAVALVETRAMRPRIFNTIDRLRFSGFGSDLRVVSKSIRLEARVAIAQPS